MGKLTLVTISTMFAAIFTKAILMTCLRGARVALAAFSHWGAGVTVTAPGLITLTAAAFRPPRLMARMVLCPPTIPALWLWAAIAFTARRGGLAAFFTSPALIWWAGRILAFAFRCRASGAVQFATARRTIGTISTLSRLGITTLAPALICSRWTGLRFTFRWCGLRRTGSLWRRGGSLGHGAGGRHGNATSGEKGEQGVRFHEVVRLTLEGVERGKWTQQLSPARAGRLLIGWADYRKRPLLESHRQGDRLDLGYFDDVFGTISRIDPLVAFNTLHPHLTLRIVWCGKADALVFHGDPFPGAADWQDGLGSPGGSWIAGRDRVTGGGRHRTTGEHRHYQHSGGGPQGGPQEGG